MSFKKIGPNISSDNYLYYRRHQPQGYSHFKWVKLMAEVLGITQVMLLIL